MKKATSKILMAAMSLIIAIGLATGTTFAWFSMNTEVTVSGMQVKTKVSSNILIAETNVEANYSASFTKAVKGILEPASSADGVAFYYTAGTNVTATGAAKTTDAYILYNASDAATGTDADDYQNAFSQNYGITKDGAAALIGGENSAKAYVDYVFYLKATNAENAEKDLKMTKCNMLKGAIGAENTVLTSVDKAWRVAMFVQNAEKETPLETAIAAGNRKITLAPSGAAYFTPTKAVSSTSALADVTNFNTETGAVVASVAANATAYYKVTVRLWLEGEDTSCNNDTYAALTDVYKLDLAFELGTENAAVKNIGSVAD